MPTIDDLGQSKYLKKSDVDPELMVVIDHYELENLAKEGQPAENKYCLYFKGNVKPLVLNKTNGELIAMTLGSKNLDDWVGRQITLYNDPSISFAGKITGGIRVRYIPPQQSVPQQSAPQQQAPPQQAPLEGFDPGDIPF